MVSFDGDLFGVCEAAAFASSISAGSAISVDGRMWQRYVRRGQGSIARVIVIATTLHLRAWTP